MSDADSPRRRILDAAREEFAEHGLAGARVDAIARRAGCNKQLLYHHIGDKNALWEAVIAEAMGSRPPMEMESRSQFAEHLGAVHNHLHSRRPFFRLMAWEALESGDGPVMAEEARRAHMAGMQEELKRLQAKGILDPSFDVRFLALAIMAMLAFPLVLPQVARLVTGLDPRSAAFSEGYARLIVAIARRLGAPPGGGGCEG